MLAWAIRILTGVVNCCRMEAADRADEASAYVGSRSMTATEALGSRRVSQ